MLFLWKPIADCPFQGVLRELLLISRSSKLLTFSYPTFSPPPFCHFPQVSGIHFCWVENFLPTTSTYSFSFWIPWGIAPLFMNGCFIPSNSLLYHWALKRDPFVLRSLCFLVLSFESFQSYLGYVVRPRDPRPLVVSRIPAQFFLLGFF